jgi:DNA repair exonuclease SbcCD ATPase subunit
MIIEGFEIESWTCIKKLTVSGLPAIGVIVLHGPNRRGKSSLVKALRACLMDYPSTSTALKMYYPRGSAEKPTVSVTFTAEGTTYRIKKSFGSNKSELVSRTSTGAWRVEAATAAEAHSRVCDLVGGDDSDKGLRQLLWLTQAEFRLPDPKKFDPNVQAQLRGILGVLQTQLDDRFIERVRKRWNEWHSGQRKAGKQHPIKDGCRLAQKQSKLNSDKADLEACETKFNELEVQLRQTNELEQRHLDLDRQLREQSTELQKCQEERERSQARIAARELADERYTNAKKEGAAALEEQRQRSEAAQRLTEAQDAVVPARRGVEHFNRHVADLEGKQAQQKGSLGERRDRKRVLQQRFNRVTAKLRAMDDVEKLTAARNALQRAQGIAQAVASLKTYLLQNPVPDKKKLEELKANREKIVQLQADRDAASMMLRLVPDDGARPAQLALDGASIRLVPSSPTPTAYSVQRKAELFIPDWGRVELSRGTSSGDLDQIEAQLQQCHEAYTNALASIGIAAGDPDAFDQLLRRIAEHGLKSNELQTQEKELKKFATEGFDPLQIKVLELETKLKDVTATDPDELDSLPDERDELENLRKDLNAGIGELNDQLSTLEADLEDLEADLAQGRADVTSAKERLAGFEATANSRQEELGRFPSEDQIAARLEQAKESLATAEDELKRSELTVEELTIDERLATSREAVNALVKQVRENEEKFNRIKGRLESSEGLHAQRTVLGARVDELTRLVEREILEKDAVDRLYELFEECREKQLGTLMGPIHDRVLNWMRVLDIGDYKEVRFSDSFLPDKLVRRDGTAEFSVEEESTGAQEQIGMLVRVALGSLLTSAAESTVAILDDPLTHCDVGRLNKMRVILRRAAEGDAKLSPPAGPLQIIILTCHPEWFRDERATVIDLENPEVMQRFPV